MRTYTELQASEKNRTKLRIRSFYKTLPLADRRRQSFAYAPIDEYCGSTRPSSVHLCAPRSTTILAVFTMTTGHNFTALVLTAAAAFSNAATILVPNTSSFYSTRSLPPATGQPFYNPVSQYHAQDSLGQYAYGYAGGPSSKSETKTLDGITRGTYSYIDANNALQTVEYTADPWNGFRATATNLPGGPLAQPISETPEVAAARAEHMAAHQAATAAQQQKPRIVTAPNHNAFTAPIAPSAPFAFAPATGSFSYSYTNGAPTVAYLYPAFPALRPAVPQYAYGAVQPSVFHRFGAELQVAPAAQPAAELSAGEAELVKSSPERSVDVSDTVSVRAERLVENVRNAFEKS